MIRTSKGGLADRPVSRRAVLGGAAASLGLTFGGALSGCSGGKGLPGSDSTGAAGSGTGELHWWTNHTEEDTELFQQRVDAFTQANPGIAVKLLNIADGQQYYTKVNTAAVGGGLPDVFYVRSFDVGPFSSRGWVLPLKDLIARDSAEVKPDDFWPAETAQLTADGSVYALPYDLSNFAVYINKSMFEAEGVPVPNDDWSWEDFFELGSHFVRKSGGRQTRWGAGINTGNWFAMGVFKAYGGATFSDDLKKCVVNSSQNVAVLQTWADQMAKGVVPTADATPKGVDPFASQLLPLSVNGSWATLQTRAAVNGKFEWDVLRLPKGSTGKREVSTAGGAWGIAKSSKNQEAAWKFVKFITNEESTNKLISDVTRSVPGRQSSAKQWEQVAAGGGLPPKHVGVFLQQLQEDAVNWAYPKFWAEFDLAWNNQVKTLGVSGKPAEILRRVEDAANTAAKRY
ncbi:ABC transporter substrate-binding protein [Kribbella sp. NPDC050124]|uniref:ABC transporter substrate-binding protein n=1 Tax=Kribbella sp. NPDC050124 TaxID=3364114 RepID=UPI0037B47947